MVSDIRMDSLSDNEQQELPSANKLIIRWGVCPFNFTNKQNPVSPNNPRREEYLAKANEHINKPPKACE